jgi:hypothetical protein
VVSADGGVKLCNEAQKKKMTIERIRDADNQQPFQPFVIRLADGRGIPVLHREFMISVPGGRTVVVQQPDETVNIIDLLLVTDLEFKPVPTNGQP